MIPRCAQNRGRLGAGDQEARTQRWSALCPPWACIIGKGEAQLLPSFSELLQGSRERGLESIASAHESHWPHGPPRPGAAQFLVL